MDPTYAVTFRNFEPAPREDGAPWTHVRIDEAADQAGPFTTIDTQELSPLDTDPTDPQERSFTTEKATMQSGWYQIVFLDDSSGSQPTAPLFHSATALGFMPGVGDVGAHLRVRTRDANGNEVGTFTNNTRPTRDQVERLIESAASKVTSKIGTAIAPALWVKASTTIALRAAMFVELSFFADQIAANRSPYNELKTLHDEEWADLFADWRNLGTDQEPGTPDDIGEEGVAVFAFPPLGPPPHAPGSELSTDRYGLDW